ncbi:hypothetical protein, partial [Streptomyces acidiscabies]|uniref:hypothetical protein n=1 Tax=Streptomyces acidiscabies TaxID=42234 RepID=UPI001C4D485C
ARASAPHQVARMVTGLSPSSGAEGMVVMVASGFWSVHRVSGAMRLGRRAYDFVRGLGAVIP